MIDRRTALKLGVISTAGAFLGHSSNAFSALSARPKNPIYRAIFDARYSEAVSFGEVFNRLGIRASGTEGDVAALWYKDLKTNLSERTGPIAGLTDQPTLFCLKELARDFRLSVVFQVDHVSDSNGRFILPPDLTHDMDDPVPAPNGGQRMANHILKADFEAANKKPLQKRTGAGIRAGQTALVTWVIA